MIPDFSDMHGALLISNQVPGYFNRALSTAKKSVSPDFLILKIFSIFRFSLINKLSHKNLLIKMKKNIHESRRSFIKKATVATASMAIPAIIPAHAFGANDRINVAVIGINGRGKDHVDGMMKQQNVQVTTFADPDLNIAGERAKEFEKKYGLKINIVQDLRKVFDNKEINVVTIATPNHWHSLATIWACQAGKDVYVEKPGSHNIFEGRKMVEAARKYDRIVQHGVQLRSSVAIREAIQLMRDGYIGKVYMARGLVFRRCRQDYPQTLNFDRR